MVRASRSADPTSDSFNCLSAIAQTRDRSWRERPEVEPLSYFCSTLQTKRTRQSKNEPCQGRLGENSHLFSTCLSQCKFQQLRVDVGAPSKRHDRRRRILYSAQGTWGM